MKRSSTIRLVLLGGISAGALAVSCGAQDFRISADSVYVNDCHIPGAGYYHAPYRAFFPQPYNFYDAQRKQYFHGGVWTDAPNRSLVNISAPTVEAAAKAKALMIVPVATHTYGANHFAPQSNSNSTTTRGGFGSSSRSHSTIS